MTVYLCVLLACIVTCAAFGVINDDDRLHAQMFMKALKYTSCLGLRRRYSKFFLTINVNLILT